MIVVEGPNNQDDPIINVTQTNKNLIFRKLAMDHKQDSSPTKRPKIFKHKNFDESMYYFK